jgi:hypothetical protein
MKLALKILVNRPPSVGGSSHLELLQFSDVILSIAVMSQEESGRGEYDDKGVCN